MINLHPAPLGHVVLPEPDFGRPDPDQRVVKPARRKQIGDTARKIGILPERGKRGFQNFHFNPLIRSGRPLTALEPVCP